MPRTIRGSFAVVPVVLACLLLFAGGLASPFSASSKPQVALHALDGLGVPNQPVTIEAKLVRLSGTKESTLPGELLELVVGGAVQTSATTDTEGKARLIYMPKRKGIVHATIRTAATASIEAATTAHVVAWERRTPLLAVETASLYGESELEVPAADAADELGKLTQFYFNVIYVRSLRDSREDLFRAATLVRAWLQEHKFPAGYVLVLPSGDAGLGNAIDELRLQGWTTLKVGVARKKAFAEAFLERRLEAIIVPEPAKGEAPRKAKTAKNWKDVRKKL